MRKALVSHPVAALFPDLNDADFAALKADIVKHGLKVPILLHGGQILDGRQRYRACQETGVACRYVEWNGHDPWLEVQSRNLLRRQLSKEQVYAIRKLAAAQFPEIAEPFEAEKSRAKARKAQARGRPRGEKAGLIGSQDRHRESADAIGAQVGVSGSTVKRVDRLAREAPHLLPRVASGELSVKRALREVPTKGGANRPFRSGEPARPDRVVNKIRLVIRREWQRCPRQERQEFLQSLEKELQMLMREDADQFRTRGLRGDGLRDASSVSDVRIGDPGDTRPHAMMAGGSKHGR